MDLVDEQDGAPPLSASRSWAAAIAARTSATPRHDRRQRLELGADGLGEQARERRLAGPGRAPQEDRREVPAVDGAPQRPALADEVLLADELVERPRPHPRRERLALRRRLEQRFGSGALDRSVGWASAEVYGRSVTRSGRGLR